MIKFFSKNRYTFFVAFIFFCALEALIYFSVTYIETSDKNDFLTFKTKEFNTQVEMGKDYLNVIAKILYDQMLETSTVTEIMYAAAHTDDPKKHKILRDKLYQTYAKEYQYMKKLGVRQLHFHLPDAVSFLRFHRPEKFGDSLVDVRESIMYVNQTKKPVECFEEGRIFNGFRHVYPIMKGDELLGTVEISYSFSALLEHMLEINKESGYLFLMNNEVIDSKVFEEEKGNYQQTAFNSYSIDKNTLKDNMGLSLDNILKINKKIASEVSDKLQNDESFAVSTFLDEAFNKNIVVSFIAVKNFENKKVAYVIGYNYSVTMDILEKRSAQMKVLLTVINIIFTYLLFILFRKENEKFEIASQKAMLDSLTGVFNRRGFDSMLNYKVAVSKRYDLSLSIVFFDIDRFKTINDGFGHDVGDNVLKELSSLVKANIRESDIFARWGGEEFVLLLPSTSLEHAVSLANKLKNEINKHQFTKIGTLQCSFGVCQLHNDETSEQFIKRADQLLYTAKETGRNKIVSDTE